MPQDLPTTLAECLGFNAENFGERTWLVSPDSGNSLTWGEAFEQSTAIAQNLIALGLEKGQSVAVAAPNSIGTVLTFLGICLAGGRATPINLVAGAKVMAYVLNHSQAKIVIADDGNRDDIDNALKYAGHSAQCYCLDFEKGALLPKAETRRAVDIKADDAALLMYTSGTTGNPKGVLLSHRNLLAAGRNVADAHQITSDDNGLCVLPIYHINGLCVTVIGSLTSASGLTMPRQFSNSQFWQQISDHDCSWFSAVPTLFNYILNNENSYQLNKDRLRFARSASAPLSPEIHRRFEKRFGIPIIETMGLTETAAQILANPMPPQVRKIGSPGIAFGNEVKIIDPETLADLPPDSEGEIVIKGDNVMMGYLDQPEETAKTITSDGWLRSGDLGRMDADGYIYVTGRIKELIIKGGENIAPREIDEVLLEHEAILEAAAFARPCDNYGQRVEACVRLKGGYEITASALISHCRERLGDFKSPDKVHILDDLPKGPSGKIQRMKLIDLVPKH